MNANDTIVNGPVTFFGPVAATSLDVSGDVTGGGFGAFFDAYSVTALAKKENVITADSPLVKRRHTAIHISPWTQAPLTHWGP